MRPILIEWNELQFFSYGTAILAAATLGGLLAWRMRPNGLFNLDQFLSICLITTAGAAIGARAFFALEHGSLNTGGALEVLRVWEKGGLGSIGVPLVVLPLLVVYCRWQRLATLEIFDYLMPFTLFGAAFQRAFGCFLAGCCHGVPTQLPWGFTFPGLEGPVHPTQLYLAVPLFVLFLLTVRWRPTPPGTKSLAVVGSYVAVNFLVGFFRVEAAGWDLWGLQRAQLIYAVMLLICLAGYFFLETKPKNRRTSHRYLET